MAARQIPKPWKHQTETKKFCTRRKVVYDASDPGTGKTRAHAEVWLNRRKKGKGSLVVVAPKTLLKSAWADDIRKFLPLTISYSICRADNREKAFDERVDVYITNIDAVKWLSKQKPSFFKRFGHEPTLLIDEITAFKHKESLRSRAIAKVKKFFPYRTGLSGTPNSNTILDLWNQMMVLDGGKLLGKSYTQFRNVACDYVRDTQYGGKWVDKPLIEEAVARKLAPVMIRHNFDECMDIPKNHLYKVYFDMPASLRKHYDKMVQQSILWLEEQGTVTAVNEGAVRTKLLQIASGAVYGDDDKGRRRNPTYKLLDRERYFLVADLVEARDYSIVFFNWKHQREELIKEFTKREIEHAVIDGNTPDKRREEIVEAYQDGAYQTLAMHPKTGAHGLTLTRGRATIVSSPFDEADFLKQGIHRIYRGGQKYRTETILVEARSCFVEQRVYGNLNRKKGRMDNFLDVLRKELKK